MRKVRIKGLPNRAHGGNAGGTGQGLNRFMEGRNSTDHDMNQFSEPDFEVNKSISAVDPSEANIEAEGGEYAVVPGMAGIPESYKINGPRHNAGGVALNLAPDSFIFSDFRDMKIKDKDVLAEFGVSVPKKGKVKGKTPADLAKKYDLNKYKKILLDPNSDPLERETAEAMIKNFNMKLGKLALVQESKKGFPQEVPAIAIPYLESIGQDPQQFAQEQPQQEQPMQAAYGGENKRMAKRFPGLDVAQRGGQYSGAFWDSILQEGGNVYAQEGLTVEEKARQAATYNYLKENNFAGNNIIVGDKEKDLTHKRYKEVMNPIKLKGKGLDRPFMGNKRIATDSIANVPGGIPVHWSESGKPTVVGKDAKAFNENYANYYSKGISNVEYFPSFNEPEEQVSVAPHPDDLQDGGSIKSVETTPDFRSLTPDQRTGYNNAMDKFMGSKKSPEQQDAYKKLIERLHAQGDYNISQGVDSVGAYYNPITVEENPEFKNGGPIQYAQEGVQSEENISEDEYQTASDYEADRMQLVEPDEWNRTIGGTKRSRKRLQAEHLLSLVKDAEAEGLNESEYTTIIDQQADAAGLNTEAYIQDVMANLSVEELEEIKKNGYILKKINKSSQTVGDKAKLSSKPTYKIPTGVKVHEEDDNYNESNVKKGDYVRRKDGKVYKATGKTFKDFEYDQLERVGGKDKDRYSRSYATINNILNDPKNKEMTDVIYENYKKNVEAGKLSNDPAIDKEMKAKLMNMSKADMMANLMEGQKQVYALSAAANADPDGIGRKLNSKAMGNKDVVIDGRTYKKNELYGEILMGLGYSKEELLDDYMIAAFQGAYQGLEQVSKMPKYKSNLKGVNLAPKGVSDEDWENSAGTGSISKVDTYFGNTSSGQAVNAEETEMGYEEAQIAKAKSVVEKADDPTYDQTSTDAPWWAQDVGNMMMTLGERASIKKYLPHSFPVDLAKPDVVYYDPSRQLAANAEQANIAAQAASSFAGPQSTYQLTGIQGQAFTQAANTLADFEGKNVGVANQYLDKVQRTLNQETEGNSNRMQKLYDQTTVANQQFDNSKRAANRNVFDAWRQGLTNATKTQTMNMLYPQYDVDPRAGGITHFTEGRAQTEYGPSGASNSYSKQYAKGWKQFQKDNPNEKYEVYRDSQRLSNTRRRGNSQRPQGNQFQADYNGMDINPYRN